MEESTTLEPGQVLTGPLFNESMRVETVQPNGPASWIVGLVGVESERFRKVTLTSADLERLTIVLAGPSFDGDGRLLRLGLQAYALGIAYEFDPYFGLSISRVDPLPHQLEAVYDYMQVRQEIQELRRLAGQARVVEESGVEAKLSQLKALLQKEGFFDHPQQRLLLFTEFKDTLEYLVARLKLWGFRVGFIHGGMKSGSRDEPGTRLHAEQQFKEGAIQVLVATEAAGEGINLQICHVLFNYDIPWNPNRLEQRMGRIHRYGQRKDCLIFNFVASNTIEGKVLQRLLEKLQEIRDALEDDAIEVPFVRSPVGTTEGKYLRRAIIGDGRPACLPMHFHEMQSLQADRGLLDYTALILPEARWEDLDPLEFERFRRFVREGQGRGDNSLVDLGDLELAKALGAVQANHSVSAVRVLALLLFGREDSLRRFLPAHEVAFQVLLEQRVEVNDFFRWPLLRVVDELLARFRARNREEEILVGMLRVGVPDHPPGAFREGVANALIHRDYTRLGAVHVQWHNDRIEIASPGGFPAGVRLDNLLVTQPRPRNPLLADAFKRAGIVERTARGIDTIFYEELRNGRPAPDYSRGNESGVVLVLPGGKANLAFVRLVAEEGLAERPLGLDSLLLLHHLWLDQRTTIADAAAVIQKGEAEAQARLQQLVERGLVEARGDRTGRTWHLSAATWRRLGEQPASVHGPGLAQDLTAQIVLQHVTRHGRITWRETAELCQLSPDQAKRLLTRLVERGVLLARGKLKGGFYVLASQNMGAPITDMGAPKKTP
ncbi:MAG: helicase-related protein [Thermodesulfobacteriota bacterium]